MGKNRSPSDPRGGHIRLHWDIVDSPAWNCLPLSAQCAYIALARGLLSFNNGDLSLPLSIAKHRGISSPTTLAKSLRALCAVGLIAITREGGCKRDGQRLPTLFRFTDHPVNAMPAKFIEAQKATNEWKAVKTRDQGAAMIKAAEAAAAEKERQNKLARAKTKTALHFLEGTAPENVAVGPQTTPENGVRPLRPLQKVELASRSESAAKPMLARLSA